MQSYTEIPAGTTLEASRPLILDNDKSVMSCFSGTVFPTTNLQVGMLCFRTDQNKLYMLTALTPTWTVILDLALGTPWTASNDGSGSGLDADLLDGQHGSYYAPLNAPVLTGIPIVNDGTLQIGPTAGTRIRIRNDSQISTDGGGTWHKLWHANNDGAASGLDADLLDGQDGAYYTAITARLGYTPVNKAADTMTGLLQSQNATGAINVATQGVPGFQVNGGAIAGDGAYMTFYRANGTYGVRFGLDTDNKLKVGGWSLGANAYEIWHSGTFDPAAKLNAANPAFSGTATGPAITLTGAIQAATVTSTGAMYASNWFRTYGSTGWYNETYAGGMYMIDTTYVRTYGGKQLYCDNHITSAGNMYAAGFQVSSARELKDDFSEVQPGALARVMGWDVQEYVYKQQPDRRVIGLVADDADPRITDGKRIDLYSMISELVAAFQEYVRTH